MDQLLTKSIKRKQRNNKLLLWVQWFFIGVLVLFLALNLYKQRWGWVLFDLVFIVVGLQNTRSIRRNGKILEIFAERLKQLP